MKKLLLTTLIFCTSLGLYAQSKTTGVVTLSSNMTAEMLLNDNDDTVTLTFTGPSDRWYALQFGNFNTGAGMQNGTDVVYYNGTTLVDAVQNNIGAAPTTDTNNWTVSSNTVSAGIRTIIATRAFNTGDSNDYTFNYSDTNVDFAWARNNGAAFGLSSHGGTNRGYSINNFFECVAPDAPTASSQSFCDGATVADLDATGEAGAILSWYASATGGTALADAAVLATGTYYVEQDLGDCPSDRTAVTVTVNSVTAQEIQDFSMCDMYVLQSLNAGNNYYTGPGGTGTMLSMGDIITTTQEIYIYAESGTTPNCTDETSFTITIIDSPEITSPGDQTVCTEYELPVLAEGNYYTGPSGTGTMLTAGDMITSNQTIYIYATTETFPACPSEEAFDVTITSVSPTADAVQNLCEGSTVFNLMAMGATGATLNWYTTETGGTALDANDLLTSGTYYVEQTLDGCTSDRTEVTVNISPLSNPIVEDQEFCGSVIVGTIDVTFVDANQGFFIALVYENETGGEPLNVNSVITESGTYYVSQSNGFCESDRVEVEITIKDVPNAPTGDAIQQFDAGATVADLEVTAEAGATVTWYVMNAAMQLVEIESTTALIDGGEYYVTQTIDGCESEPFMVTANENLSSATFTGSSFKIYPNPVDNMFTISGNETIAEVRVVNLLGQEVMSKQFNSEEVTVNIEQLPQGTYIAQIATVSGATSSYKIMKK
ncbi:hypothetical protein GCM10007424_26390 [Flavobacterium suaedae]|uniref:T9SS type A sorting domain-containing protein n=1 Tax=Flavobacterium suaedae TaxID=1767027 RepID=A0ABQ1K6H4_9FLAO|nr:T9SS type A sorting domain-containing protein [Flavobacterium suaedae]GGB85064.1 hypothetical protein GCM10007424_26390 [Flavobacterium suaedae]